MKIGVDVVFRSPNLNEFTVDKVMAEAFHRRNRLITAEILIAGFAVVSTDFEFIEPAAGILHERLLTYAPADRHSREIAPFVFGAELR